MRKWRETANENLENLKREIAEIPENPESPEKNSNEIPDNLKREVLLKKSPENLTKNTEISSLTVPDFGAPAFSAVVNPLQRNMYFNRTH